MSVFGVIFFVSICGLAILQLSRGRGRIRVFGVRTVPLALVIYLIVTVLVWYGFAPRSISDVSQYKELGLIELAISITTLVYVVASVVLRRE